MPLEQLARDLHARPGLLTDEPVAHHAAVAAIFAPGGELLFIRRSDREGDPWSGHMAFPGGRRSPDDRDLQHTAERETREEVGLDLAEGRLLGRLDDLLTPRRAVKLPTMVIRPYVYHLARPPALQPNHEVAGIHWFSLDRLRAREGRGTLMYNWEGTDYELPCIRLDGTTIWGLTLSLVDQLLDRLARQDSERSLPAPP